MKTKAKIFIIAASLGLLSTQAFTASSGIDQRDHFRFDRNNPAGQDVIVENNYYYGDGDYIYDYYYASRIRRFHKPYVSYSYYNSYYTDCYWYTYEPAFWGMSIYLGSMWNPVGLSISFGFPYRSYYQSYYYNPYPWYPVYNIVYRPRIVNRDYYRDGYYSSPYKYASNVVPSRTPANRDNNRNSNVINSSRRSSPTNTPNINRSQHKTETRRSTYVPSTNRSSRAVYKAPQKNSNRTRISKPAKTKKSNVRSGNSRSTNSSKKVTRSSGKSKSDQKKSSGRRR